VIKIDGFDSLVYQLTITIIHYTQIHPLQATPFVPKYKQKLVNKS